jgi:ABC-2 type transport system permease protein
MTAVPFAHSGMLVRRSVLKVARQPANLVFSFAFPLLLLLVNSGGLKAATSLPGFPTDSYITFALAVPFIQGALFAALTAGTNLGQDIESGFLKRLALTPLSRTSLLMGHLSGAVALGVFQAVVYLAVGEAAGAGFQAGLPGIPVLLALSITITVAFAAVGAWAALRSGSAEAVQGMFPLFFVFLFLSSMALPRDLISHDWFRTIATINPVSYLLEAIRSLLITGWDGEALALGFGCAIGIGAVGVALSSIALRTRMVRT